MARSSTNLVGIIRQLVQQLSRGLRVVIALSFTSVSVLLITACSDSSAPDDSFTQPTQTPSAAVSESSGAQSPLPKSSLPKLSLDKSAVVQGYRRLGHLSYQEAYHAAGALKRQIKQFLRTPSADTLANAQQAWRQARQDYSQTEVFRFGNWVVDDWEGNVNAWPVDEGLLDYVHDAYEASPTNPLSQHNLVANATIQVGAITITTNTLDWAQLKFVHGASDHESNVVVGYHAIEFLLWGQDLNRTVSGAGERPWTDYAVTAEQCTSGKHAAPLRHCQRRRQLLLTTAEYLYTQLGNMTLSWAGNSPVSYGRHIVTIDANEGLRRMLFGMIRLAGDEMAGERLQVALLSGSPEEEQDCFSDDTHNSAFYNLQGIHNIYYGQLRHGKTNESQSKLYEAPSSMADLAREVNADLAAKIDTAMHNSQRALAKIKQLGDNGDTFDLLITPEHPIGEQVILDAVQALQTTSQLLEQLGYALGLARLNPQSTINATSQ